MQTATLIFSAGTFVMSAAMLIGGIILGRKIKKDVDAGLATASEKASVVKDALANLQSVL